MTAILIADDHPAARAGLRVLLLDNTLNIEEIGEATSGNEVLEQLRRRKWQLLILDISMPQRSGIDVLPQVHAGFPDMRILVTTMFGERQYARQMLRAGADGFVTKDASGEDLIDAVRTVLAGRRYVSAALAELLAEEGAGDTQRLPHESLSVRELQVMRRLAEGQSQAVIANELCLAPKTVSGYRGRILRRLGFDSEAQLTVYAIRNGLIA